MAVQKSRKTPSKRGMRRSHNALKSPALSEDQGSEGWAQGPLLNSLASVRRAAVVFRDPAA
jgi:hypothetical protein